MNWKHVSWLSVAILGGLSLHAYIGAKLDVARDSQVKQDVQDQIKGIRSDLAGQLSKIQADRKISAPRQIVVRIPEYIPGLPVAPTLSPEAQMAKTVPQGPTVKDYPDAPEPQTEEQGIYFPPEDVKPLYDRLTACKENEVNLDACRQELGLTQKQAKAAEKAMRGGSFWSRLKSNARWFVVGGLAGGVAVCATGHCR